jgi:hypothetical protein
MRPVIPKKHLLELIERFCEDKDRGISVMLFAELSGVSLKHFKDVFIDRTEPLTETIQRRVSKAYEEWRDGNVRVMQNRDRTRFVEYRKEPKPLLRRDNRLIVENGRIVLKPGIVNRSDYNRPTLGQQLRRPS